jgi:hypothetical protein
MKHRLCENGSLVDRVGTQQRGWGDEGTSYPTDAHRE